MTAAFMNQNHPQTTLSFTPTVLYFLVELPVCHDGKHHRGSIIPHVLWQIIMFSDDDLSDLGYCNHAIPLEIYHAFVD